MDLTDLATIRSLCTRYGIRPDPDAGQHFLVSRQALAAVVAAAELTTEDTVLEVGLGLGTLTAELAQRVGRVVAVELDPKLAAAAHAILSPYANVEIITGNFLTLPPGAYRLSAQRYKLVANLPYHITGRFFRRVLTGEPAPTLMAVMVQAEVADRLTAPAGQLSSLGVFVQLTATVSVVARVSPESFWPLPEVGSAIIKLVPRPAANVRERLGVDNVQTGVAAVMRVVRSGFAARRKTLMNNLLGLAPHAVVGTWARRQRIAEALAACAIPVRARAQELQVEQWITLAKKLENYLN